MVSFKEDCEVIEGPPRFSPHNRTTSEGSTSSASDKLAPVEHNVFKATKRHAPTPYPRHGFDDGLMTKLDSDAGPFGWLKKAFERPKPVRQCSEFEHEAIAQLDGHEWAKEHLRDPAHDPAEHNVALHMPTKTEKKYGHDRKGSRARSITTADLMSPSLRSPK